MLPARNRMTRSTEFGATVNRGVRAVQSDIVVHARRDADSDEAGPKVDPREKLKALRAELAARKAAAPKESA